VARYVCEQSNGMLRVVRKKAHCGSRGKLIIQACACGRYQVNLNHLVLARYAVLCKSIRWWHAYASIHRVCDYMNVGSKRK
jgi:hypothetical protein